MDLKYIIALVLLAGLLTARFAYEATSRAFEAAEDTPWFARIQAPERRAAPQPDFFSLPEPLPLPLTILPDDTARFGGATLQRIMDNAVAEPVQFALNDAGGEPEQAADKPTKSGVVDRIWPTVDRVQGDVAPQKTRRRDPLSLPLVDPDAWLEWLLSVTINGKSVSEGTLVIENPANQRLAIAKHQAETWRIIFDLDDLITFQGEPFLPLDRIAGLVSTVDHPSLTLNLVIPPRRFEDFELELAERSRPEADATNGLFLDYDLLLNAGDSLRSRLDGLIEAGGFSKLGVFTSTLQLQDIANDPDAVRLETALTRDFPGERRTIRLGDSLSAGGDLAQAVRFAGLQWGTNFATDPTFVSFPLPAIGGLVEQQSVVDVIVDNLSRATQDVPPGPFSINNVPVVTGSGEVQLRVTDLLGRETLIAQPYYVSDRLLRPGLHDFSYAVGFERERYGLVSFDYDRPMATVLHRLGVSDVFTVSGYGEATLGTVRGALGGVFKAGSYGLISATAGLSGDDDAGAGITGSLAYEYASSGFNFSARSQHESADHRTIGPSRTDIRRTDQVNLGIQLGDFGRLGLLYLNRKIDQTEDARSLSASYSMPLGDGAMILRAGHTLKPSSDTALTASYAVPLGNARSATVELDRQNGEVNGRSSFRQGRGASDIGLDYRLSAEAGERPTRFDGRVGYASRYATGTVDLQRFDEDSNVRAGLSGSLALMDGDLTASRTLGRAFGLVSLQGYPDVRVYMDNREMGKTGADGTLLIPNLRPYQKNRLRFDVSDLPLSARIKSDEIDVTPFDRTGIKVAFDIDRLNEVTATMLDGSGDPVASGTRLASLDKQVQVRIGRNGFAHIQGEWTGSIELVGQGEDGQLRCLIDQPPDDILLPDLGEVRCQDH